MKPTMCSFNTGVYVADMDRWKSQNITKKLLYWMNLNTKYAKIFKHPCRVQVMKGSVFKNFNSA